MRTVEVLVIQPISDAELEEIAAIDSHLHVIDARGWFDGELRETLPARMVQRHLANRRSPPSSRADRDRLLASAEVIFAGWRYPMDLGARAPRLRWFHRASQLSVLAYRSSMPYLFIFRNLSHAVHVGRTTSYMGYTYAYGALPCDK